MDTVDLEEPPVSRSALVSVVAWFGILGGAMGTLSGLILMLSAPSMTAVSVLVGGAATLYSAIGLRARREWARVGFMVVLAITSLAGIIGALRFRIPGGITVSPAGGAPAMTPEQLNDIVHQMRPMMIGMAVVSAIVNALLIAYFSSQRVRREFD